MTNRRLALVVAVDHYAQAVLNRLASPAADAEALVGVLGNPDLGGFEVDVLRNSHSWTICQHVEGLLADRHPTDLVLLHFSCHGLKDATGELYLAATNTRPELLGSTAVEAAWINRVMQRSRARRVVLLLDCCYGGAFERGVVARAGDSVDVGDQFPQAQLGEGQGRVVITASTAMEYAFEGATLTEGGPAEPSMFTGAVVEGIESGDADRDQDGYVSLGELYDFVYDRVRERTANQTPSKWEFGVRGEFYVSQTPRQRIRSAGLTSGLAELVQHPLPSMRLTAVHHLVAVAEGQDISSAEAARRALQHLIDDDSRAVSTAAAVALSETRVRLATDTVDLGWVAPGNLSVTCEVLVLGGPLALSSLVDAMEPLRAWIAGSTLYVNWLATTPGELDEMVTLRGPAGTAHLRVTGRATAQLPPAPDHRRQNTDSAIPQHPNSPRDSGIKADQSWIWAFLAGIGVLIVIILAVALWQSWHESHIFNSETSDFSVGDCIKKSGDDVIAAACGSADAFIIASIVDTKDKCADKNKPYVINQTKSGQSQVLCLTSST